MNSLRLYTFLLFCICSEVANGQLFYGAPAQFGGRTGTGLFQVQNGQVTQLNTGFVEHNFPSVSRDTRFIAFSSPDGVVAPLQVPPSSDIYVFDRAFGQTQKVIDHSTLIFSPNEVDTFTPVSAALSPNNQLIAYGVVLTRREGTGNARSTRELNIARVSDGVIVSNPTFGRGPVTDAFQSEFVGLSWDPGGNSFVTPSYVTVGITQLPAIVRYSFNQNNSSWFLSEVLSTPVYLNNQFPVGAITHIYPVISPSGTGLAYFELFTPDALQSSQAVVARILLSDADGGNPRVLTTFDQGQYPAGLGWSSDGSTLVASTANQLSSSDFDEPPPIRYFAAANVPTATLWAIDFSTGNRSVMSGSSPRFWPSFGVSSFNVPDFGALSGVRLEIISDGNGQFRIRATGVQSNKVYALQSSPSLEEGSFGPTQDFTGAQLLEGVPLTLPTPNRLFRLINQ